MPTDRPDPRAAIEAAIRTVDPGDSAALILVRAAVALLEEHKQCALPRCQVLARVVEGK